jgi:putative tricarboxylic transport membrane protein
MPPVRTALGRLKGAIPYATVTGGAAYLMAAAGRFAETARPGELGPDFWPRAILVLLMVVSAGAALRRLLVAPAAGGRAALHDTAGDLAPPDAHDAPLAPAEEPPAHPYRLLAGIALSVAYVAGLEWVGFFLATALYLGLFMAFGRYRRPGVIVSASLLGSLAFVFVFMKIVYVSLPLGVGPFRTLSVALLAVLGIR